MFIISIQFKLLCEKHHSRPVCLGKDSIISTYRVVLHIFLYACVYSWHTRTCSKYKQAIYMAIESCALMHDFEKKRIHITCIYIFIVILTYMNGFKYFCLRNRLESEWQLCSKCVSTHQLCIWDALSGPVCKRSFDRRNHNVKHHRISVLCECPKKKKNGKEKKREN